MYSCHTSCDLLNAGTYQSELEIVAGWLKDHPYDVVTILIVNSDLTTVENFVPAIQNSGLAEYLYTPKYVPQHKDQWPTLSEMILTNERAVVFMDYNANQTAVPYILDEFTHMWETPFSPQDPAFPCTIQRPPKLDPKDARENYMYLANHNLNLAVDVSAILGNNDGQTVLIPNTAVINRTNGEFDTFGQLGEMAANCSGTYAWALPPYTHILATSVHFFASRLITNPHDHSYLGRSAQLPPSRLLQLRRSKARLCIRSGRALEQRPLQSAVLRLRSECCSGLTSKFDGNLRSIVADCCVPTVVIGSQYE